MGIEKNKQIVEAFYQAGDRGDMEACLGMLADDIRWTNIGSTRFSGTYVGKQTLVEQLIGPLFAELKAGISSGVKKIHSAI